MSPTPLFPPSVIEQTAFPTVVQDGRALFESSPPLHISMVSEDVIATFSGPTPCTCVVSTGSYPQHTCSCGYHLGGACEHVVAAMLSANAGEALQIGMDFTALDSRSRTPDDEPEQRIRIETIRSRPAPRLYLRECQGELVIELRFVYYDATVEFSRSDRDRSRLVMQGGGCALRIERSRARETELAALLLQQNLRPYSSGCYAPCINSLVWMRDDLPVLAQKGFQVFGQEQLTACRVRQTPPRMLLRVSRSADTLLCQTQISIDALPVSLRELYHAAVSGASFVRLSDGTSASIPREWIDKMNKLLALGAAFANDSSLAVSAQRTAVAGLLDSLAASSDWEQIAARGTTMLHAFESLESQPLPVGLRAHLRPYQRSGYDWFAFLRRFGLGGCLADDMGLGKTVQSLALLLEQKEHRCVPRTSLLIVPTTLLFNWIRESRAFAPSLLIMLYHGPGRKRYRTTDMHLADIVLTTYGTVQRDIDELSPLSFNYLIIDEAQAIKNPLGATSSALRRLNARYRLALSGTPIENNLSELWSLFTFLNPGMLGSYRSFRERFVRPIEKEGNSAQAHLLRTTIHPCILRRTKAQVATELPPKTETIQFVEMEPAQRRLYTITRDLYRTTLMHTLDSKAGINDARMKVLSALMRLRQICVDPRLVDAKHAGDSGKGVCIDEEFDALMTAGHKVLFFSQFVTALELFKTRIDARGSTTLILTGKSRDRAGLVDRFQSDPAVAAMFISLKAGGTGLNLTAADYVIHLDPWWNPAAERQASDRAWRIGQTKPVFVYKYITKDSVEERVLELQESKRALFDSIITTEASIVKSLTRDDIMHLFS